MDWSREPAAIPIPRPQSWNIHSHTLILLGTCWRKWKSQPASTRESRLHFMIVYRRVRSRQWNSACTCKRYNRISTGLTPSDLQPTSRHTSKPPYTCQKRAVDSGGHSIRWHRKEDRYRRWTNMLHLILRLNRWRKKSFWLLASAPPWLTNLKQ